MAVTGLILLPRSMGEAEAVGGGMWLAIIHFALVLSGCANPHPVGLVAWVGVGLFVAGSTINTASEVGRLRFKRGPANTGRLYTGGLFSGSTPVNYFGDILWCLGMALIAGRAITLVISALMTAMLVSIDIPRLDAYRKEIASKAVAVFLAWAPASCSCAGSTGSLRVLSFGADAAAPAYQLVAWIDPSYINGSNARSRVSRS